MLTETLYFFLLKLLGASKLSDTLKTICTVTTRSSHFSFWLFSTVGLFCRALNPISGTVKTRLCDYVWDLVSRRVSTYSPPHIFLKHYQFLRCIGYDHPGDWIGNTLPAFHKITPLVRTGGSTLVTARVIHFFRFGFTLNGQFIISQLTSRQTRHGFNCPTSEILVMTWPFTVATSVTESVF